MMQNLSHSCAGAEKSILSYIIPNAGKSKCGSHAWNPEDLILKQLTLALSE